MFDISCFLSYINTLTFPIFKKVFESECKRFFLMYLIANMYFQSLPVGGTLALIVDCRSEAVWGMTCCFSSHIWALLSYLSIYTLEGIGDGKRVCSSRCKACSPGTSHFLRGLVSAVFTACGLRGESASGRSLFSSGRRCLRGIPHCTSLLQAALTTPSRSLIKSLHTQLMQGLIYRAHTVHTFLCSYVKCRQMAPLLV